MDRALAGARQAGGVGQLHSGNPDDRLTRGDYWPACSRPVGNFPVDEQVG